MSTPFTLSELEIVLTSLQNASGPHASSLDWPSISSLLSNHAHLPHKNWAQTETFATKLEGLIGNPDSDAFRCMFHRVLTDGNWDDAASHALSSASDTKQQQPWVTLVTGTNGIRKTTSIAQPWFTYALFSSLPPSSTTQINKEDLPSASNAFFRQLDFIIATVSSNHFASIYQIPSLPLYSTSKAHIFTRYRCVSEAVGIILLRSAIRKRMNVFVETSGRNEDMYEYIDYLFSKEEEKDYKKLVVHFTINDIAHAEKSVDIRMVNEMRIGLSAISSSDLPSLERTRSIVNANLGGPYGCEILKGVQSDSDGVWVKANAGGREDWSKAEIRVIADADAKGWNVRSVRDGEAVGECYSFVDK